jgi:hypothetical protein
MSAPTRGDFALTQRLFRNYTIDVRLGRSHFMHLKILDGIFVLDCLYEVLGQLLFFATLQGYGYNKVLQLIVLFLPKAHYFILSALRHEFIVEAASTGHLFL